METPTPLTLDTPDFESYPVSDEALVAKMNATEKRAYEMVYESGEKQEIGVSFIPGRPGNKETIIINTPWSDTAHRDFNVLRHAALAEHTGADVIIVGFPGHDPDLKGGITKNQRKQLTSNEPSFAKAGEPLAKAVMQLSRGDDKVLEDDYWSSRDVMLAGYSQGASSQIGMLRNLDSNISKRITDLFIWESPDLMDAQSKMGLGSKFMRDGMKAGKYYTENEQAFGKDRAKELGVNDPGPLDIGKLATRMLITQPRQLLTGTPNAIANSTLERDILEVDGLLKDVHIHVINGGDSLVSPPEQGDKLVSTLTKELKSKDIDHVVRLDDSHPAQESLPRYSDTIHKLKK